MERLIEGIGPTVRETVRLPGSDVAYEIVRPDDMDRLLDRAEGDPEQNLPYWAELWPSGIALAAAICLEPAVVSGQRCLELGCGLGVTAVAALRAGADLLVTDYAPESLALCRVNAAANAGREPETLQLNWRAPSPELRAAAGDGFPVVLAADVLYERRDIEPLLALVDWLVAPHGLLWLAEPGRPPAAAFVEAMLARGWRGEESACSGPWPDPKDDGVTVRVHRLVRG